MNLGKQVQNDSGWPWMRPWAEIIDYYIYSLGVWDETKLFHSSQFHGTNRARDHPRTYRGSFSRIIYISMLTILKLSLWISSCVAWDPPFLFPSSDCSFSYFLFLFPRNGANIEKPDEVMIEFPSLVGGSLHVVFASRHILLPVFLIWKS